MENIRTHTEIWDDKTATVVFALCLRALSQAPQHFSSSETQAVSDGYPARLSIYYEKSINKWEDTIGQMKTTTNKQTKTA